MHYDLIIFDLDGTLADTSPGIFNSVRYAEKEMGLSPVPDAKLREFVGPAPSKMYEDTYGLTPDDAMRATLKHREYGAEKGFCESTVYPGIRELLQDLKADGYKLAVATLKNEQTAINLLKYQGIDHFFDCVHGMDTKESNIKADILMEVIRECNAKKPVVVGDTWSDYIAAVKCNVEFIGVSYGFGFQVTETSVRIACEPDEIRLFLQVKDN